MSSNQGIPQPPFPPPPPPPQSGSAGGAARTGTPPVGFGPGSSPLTHVRPQPLSRASTPSASASGNAAASASPAPSDMAPTSARSPFASQPAPFHPSPSPAPPAQGGQPGPQRSAAGRVTSPLARTVVSSPPTTMQAQARPPPPHYPYQQQQQQMYSPQSMPPQQGYSQAGGYPAPMPPPGSMQQVQSPPLPASVPAPAPVPGSMAEPAASASTSSRRRLYPEHSAAAYDTPPPQQQHQHQYQQPNLPPYPQGGNIPPYSGAPGASYAAQPAAGQNAGSGGFFVPGAAQPMVSQPQSAPGMPPISGAGMQGYPPYPGTTAPSQAPQQPGYAPPTQPAMGEVAQQFSQMGLGPNPQEYEITVLGGRPQLSMISDEPPSIKLPPNTQCVPSQHATCPPSHKRSTLNAVPKTDKLLKKTKLPFGMIITPFKSQDEGDAPIPTATEIVRCRRCRTYINPFVLFVEGGRRWKCNLCGLNNDVPLYFDYDSATQMQKDRWRRPDLNHSVIEFIAPAEYMVRPPMPPVYVFIIDVSYASVQLGVPEVIGQTILSALDNIPNVDGRSKVAFIAIDSALHFFQIQPDSAEPHQFVISDLDDVFLPSPKDLLLNLSECRAGIETLLSRLGSMFKENHSVGNTLCPAIQSAQKLLGSLGGKIIVMLASPPTVGDGKIEPRPEGKDLGTPRESELLRPQNSWYKNLAAECSRVQIAFDTVFFGQQPMDIATVSGLARHTGGSQLHYPSFMATREPEVLRFKREFSSHLSAMIGLEAVLRIRASKGLRMTSYYGNFFLRSLDLLALPNVTPNHSYAVEVEIEETITAPVVFFQTALLHTTSFGERRIRVSTLALPTTDNIHTVFHKADQVAIASLMAKKAVDRAIVAKLEDAREALQHKTLEIIGAFKTECTRSSSGATTQLQIPRSLQLLPFLTLASLKHTSLRSGNNVFPAVRMTAINFVLTLPAEQGIQPYTVPRLYSLHDLPAEAGYVDENTGIVTLPPSLGLSAEVLSPHGIYLLHDGHDMFLWLGRDANPAICQSMFNVQDVRTIPSGVITIPDLSNGSDTAASGFELNFQVKNIIRRLNGLCHNLWNPVVYVCKEDGEALLRLMLSQRLVEDMDTSAPSYQQFLNQLRDKINRGNF
ncbi:COPII subunit [Coemansia sp. RSA 1813]|nr:COPII subunit [Coemansia sp. RSA 1646]KAJ1773188.1 COPII subunit [Coemansia sp. RSA 1843]KAJ2092065.1 COPII subunit [Coemansia sp. RSA 986]KAJ2216599.1 COPII subunit [Coemansia sp. RSA 487]KAJ2572118.1 COPII subunit [Coemansia sp. RSA 1813]